MDDLERDRQVGCGEEQGLKTDKPTVLAIMKMIRSPFYLYFFQKNPKMIVTCGMSFPNQAEFEPFCLAA